MTNDNIASPLGTEIVTGADMTCMEHGFLWSPLGTARQKELSARKLSMPIASEFVDASTEEAVYFRPHPEPVRDVDGDYVMGDNDNNSGTNDICRSSIRNPAKHDHCIALWSKRYAVLLDTSIRAKKYSHLAPETVDEGLRHMGVATEGGTVEGKKNVKPMDAYDIFAFALKSASQLGLRSRCEDEQKLSSASQLLIPVLEYSGGGG
ncbi:hypothetical protein V1504DRAFT_436185 [Lipomyces starkeyi]